MENQMSEVEIRTYRYERKFLIRDLDVGQVRLLVNRHPAMFYQPFPPRYINNLYLDSEDLHSYYANVDGAEERYKVRIRWYGDLRGQISRPVLEIKLKSGLVGTKHTYPFPSFQLDEAFGHPCFQEIALQANLPEKVQYMLRNLRVVLCNRYYRWYYATRDERFRVTVDAGMEYYHIYWLSNQFRYRFKDQRTVILELKYDKTMDMVADRIAGYFPFTVSKNSKYVTGIEHVY
jgi:hypothetical protein